MNDAILQVSEHDLQCTLEKKDTSSSVDAISYCHGDEGLHSDLLNNLLLRPHLWSQEN